MRSSLPLIYIALAAGGCAHAATRNSVFVSPASYVGRSVQLCGYMIDSSNILESRRRREWNRTGGLSIRDGGPLRLRFRGRVCVEGDVSYLGCGEGSGCTGAAFEYAISITRVISREPGPDHGE